MSRHIVIMGVMAAWMLPMHLQAATGLLLPWSRSARSSFSSARSVTFIAEPSYGRAWRLQQENYWNSLAILHSSAGASSASSAASQPGFFSSQTSLQASLTAPARTHVCKPSLLQNLNLNMTCGTEGSTFPVIIGGDCPIVVCMLNVKNPNTILGPLP